LTGRSEGRFIFYLMSSTVSQTTKVAIIDRMNYIVSIKNKNTLMKASVLYFTKIYNVREIEI
jgi:hypothetical protein